MRNMEDGSLATSLLPTDGSATAHGGGATAVLVFSTSVALCGALTLGSALGYSSPAESGIREDAGLSLSARKPCLVMGPIFFIFSISLVFFKSMYSVFTSAVTVGAMIGAAFSGKISDLIGRRATMGLAQVLALFGWLAIAFSKSNVWWLDIGRLAVGIGMGILSFLVPVYITEIMPKNLRGSFTVANQFLVVCGIALMFFIGTVLNWRILALLGAVPSLLQLLGLFFIPESPRWLASISRDEELEAALRRLRGKGADISEESAAIKEYTEAFQHLSDTGIMNLFQWRYARSLTVGIGLMLLQQLGGCTAVISFASSIFELADFSSNVGTIGIAIIQIPATATSVLLLDKVGRRPLLLFSVIGMCSSCFLVGLSFLLLDLGQLMNVTPYLVFIGITIYCVSYTVGLAGTVWVIMSEIFPINIKGSAGSLVAVVNWLGALATVFSFNFLAEWSSAGTFFLFSCVNGLGILFIVKLVPETMGRSIEEIQASITYLK